MEYSVVIKDTKEGGYVGICRELPKAKSQGETVEDLLENMKDAIRLTLEVHKEDQAEPDAPADGRPADRTAPIANAGTHP